MTQASRADVRQTRASGARVAVAAGVDDAKFRTAAETLAGELALPFLERAGSAADPFDLLLVLSADRLELREIGRKRAGPIFVDFVHGPLGYRRRGGCDRRQPLARAVGLRRGPCTVVDATAGLARDAFLLASLGCTVLAVERSVVLAALIRDGLMRAEARADKALKVVLDRIKLVIGDACAVLPGLSGAAAPDVVYLDPMYPPGKKPALGKKEMRICRYLVGDDRDADALLEAARKAARRRVVVKRPHRAPPLAPRPVIRYLGTQVRYDVYRPLEPSAMGCDHVCWHTTAIHPCLFPRTGRKPVARGARGYSLPPLPGLDATKDGHTLLM